MKAWKPVFVLPNIELGEAIEGELAALAPVTDSRVTSLCRSLPKFKAFLGRFSDAFGVKFVPTVLLVRADAPNSFYRTNALGGFRDAVAIAAIAYSHACELKHRRGLRVMFGNAFAFYPWMTDRDDEHLVASTPAILGLHDVAKFHGQSSPEIFRMHVARREIDEPLLRELLARWRRRYEAPSPAWPDIALFRSLNMAHHATLPPAATDTTFYDVGRLLSLWVSAFEILVHPGGNGQANRDKVFDLLETIEWKLRKSAEKRHPTGGKQKIDQSLACWLYQLLYERRNDFLHGNPVERGALQIPESGPELFKYAAPLYRMALTAFLPLKFPSDVPSSPDVKVLGRYIADRAAFFRYQETYEDALLTALTRSNANS